MKQATLHIDLDSILYNYRHLKCYYKKNIIAVLKDDAYGIGLIEVMNTLKHEEGLIIAVNEIKDIIRLRNEGYGKEILYLNVFDEDDIDNIVKHDVTVIVENIEQLKLVKKHSLKFHLKFNCGMNRLGLSHNEIIKAIDVINHDNSYLLSGVMTHFPDDDDRHERYRLFEKYVKLINKKNIIIHCFASSSLNEYFDNISTHIRVGLKLYGITERCSFLHYALSLTSPILTIKKINKGQKVGYDSSYETLENGYLIILPIGYGNGMYRYEHSICYLDNMYLKQAGKISMDYATYFTTKNIDKNKEIELLGKNVPIESIAKINNISPHQIIVNLKVKKEYIQSKIKSS